MVAPDEDLAHVGGMVLLLGAVAILVGIGYAIGHSFKCAALRDLYQDNHVCNSRGMFLSQRQDDLIICQRPGRTGAKVILQRSELRR